MTRKNVSVAIVFGDISGSTRLYETLGDAVARELVEQCLGVMAECVDRYHGRVVKTIGDEVMCTFTSADDAVEAAMGMQEGVTEDLPQLNPNTPAGMSVRVGLHYGPAIEEEGDVFGDAVNVAARMASLAKGGQILTTQETSESLGPALRAGTRHLDRLTVKGKAGDIDIYEVVWQPDDVTRMASGVIGEQNKAVQLALRYNEMVLNLDESCTPKILGRGKKADLIVDDTMASREHARIECRRGKFILTDQSTNGTYVLTPDGPVYLRREDITLTGQGKIALGRDLNEAREVVLYDCG